MSCIFIMLGLAKLPCVWGVTKGGSPKGVGIVSSNWLDCVLFSTVYN